MIKLIFESDIPEFAGKTWRDKIALRRLAMKNDKSIFWLNFAFGGCLGLVIAVSVFAGDCISMKYLHCYLNLFSFLVLIIFISLPCSYLFQWSVLNPRMKKYFENEKRKS